MNINEVELIEKIVHKQYYYHYNNFPLMSFSSMFFTHIQAWNIFIQYL